MSKANAPHDPRLSSQETRRIQHKRERESIDDLIKRSSLDDKSEPTDAELDVAMALIKEIEDAEMKPELKPCPFCGSIEIEYDEDGGFVICNGDGCGMMGPDGGAGGPPFLGGQNKGLLQQLKQEAIRKWNTRAPVVEPPTIPCEFPGCPNEAVYEGWYRRRDPFLGTATGHIVRIAFCESCKSHPHLCINEPKKSETTT